jgi:hypothetical protein
LFVQNLIIFLDEQLKFFTCKKTLLNVSAGRFKINVSKKTLKFNLKLILQKVFNSLKSFLVKHKTLIKLIIPINRRVQILKLIWGVYKEYRCCNSAGWHESF